jgi:4-amino-4-deoxy-L-arabinose transferase-like glycosyltransferase
MLEATGAGDPESVQLRRFASHFLAFVAGALGTGMALLGMLVSPAPGSGAAFGATFAVVAGIAIASGSVLGGLGAFSPSAAVPAVQRVSGKLLLPGLLQTGAAGVLFTWLIRAAGAGNIPGQRAVLAVGVPLSFLLGVHGIARVLGRLRNTSGEPPPTYTHAGLWLVGVAALLYLPMLGNFGLIDPWEPQYAEVARNMLSRRDWISLWWGDEGWFFSKPILDMALIAASYAWFGVDFRPEGMLSGIDAGRLPQPEWATRMPIFVFAVAAVYVLYKGAAHAFGKRAALFGGIVLATMPYWFLLSRQAMTDMPYVAPLAAGLGFMLLALLAPPDLRVNTYEITLYGRVISVSAFHGLFMLILGLGLVQVVYLLSRHVSLDLSTLSHFSLHRDQVFTGSPENCGLPGNAPCQPDTHANSTPLQPALMAAFWGAALGALVVWKRHERRLGSLCFIALWLCVALACQGKAAPGLVLPVATLIAVLIGTGRVKELGRCEWGALALLLVAIVAPWFVQEYARHGAPFFDRLFIHDMYARAFDHVHDTNTGDDTSFRYYVWQLGYGLFPWGGVCAAGALWCIMKSAQPSSAADDAASKVGTILFVVWLLTTFGLFTIAGTKFHHYIAPLVPAAAMLAGAMLDEWWKKQKAVLLSCLALGAAVSVALVTRDLASSGPNTIPGPARFLHLFSYLYSRPWPAELRFNLEVGVLGGVAALGCLALAVPAWRRWAVLALLGTGLCASVWCMDIYLPRVAPHWGQRENISEYYRARRGPDELLVAYAQNWMGENFYTGNRVATFKSPGQTFKRWLTEQRNKGTQVLFFTTEHSTIPRLKRELGSVRAFEQLTTAQANNKFALVRVTL